MCHRSVIRWSAGRDAGCEDGGRSGRIHRCRGRGSPRCRPRRSEGHRGRQPGRGNRRGVRWRRVQGVGPARGADGGGRGTGCPRGSRHHIRFSAVGGDAPGDRVDRGRGEYGRADGPVLRSGGLRQGADAGDHAGAGGRDRQRTVHRVASSFGAGAGTQRAGGRCAGDRHGRRRCGVRRSDGDHRAGRTDRRRGSRSHLHGVECGGRGGRRGGDVSRTAPGPAGRRGGRGCARGRAPGPHGACAGRTIPGPGLRAAERISRRRGLLLSRAALMYPCGELPRGARGDDGTSRGTPSAAGPCVWQRCR